MENTEHREGSDVQAVKDLVGRVQVSDLRGLAATRLHRLRKERAMSQQALSPASERVSARSAIVHAIAKTVGERGQPTVGVAAIPTQVLDVTSASLQESTALGDAGRDQSERPTWGPPTHPPEAPLLQGRDDEIEKVMRSLTSASGPHFWLIVAPPKLGKTWFLHRLDTGLKVSGWLTTYVDLRNHSADAPDEVGRLIALLFGLDSVPAAEPPTAQEIAQRILRSRRSYLCLLDSAELLDENAAHTLRSYLGHVHDLIQRTPRTDIRLGVVVASRSDNEWRGVTPNPRLSMLPLRTFDLHAVQETLVLLAEDMGRTFDVATYKDYASRAYRITDGLPALLIQCLEWIRRQQWLGMDQLESYELFEKFAKPYIDQVLLADDSLFSLTHRRSGRMRHVLEQALLFLVPYRLFTQSHLRYHFDSDHAFADAIQAVDWSTGDLWRALSGTALLQRPLDEPWQEIHPAIRRLLYRYYYKSDKQRADAHREALKFVQIWADKQSGREQVIGLVESLWHEANFLRLIRSAEMESILSESARKLSEALRPSAAYTVAELRTYAANRITEDDEFQAAVDNIGGFGDRLAEIVAAPL